MNSDTLARADGIDPETRNRVLLLLTCKDHTGGIGAFGGVTERGVALCGHLDISSTVSIGVHGYGVCRGHRFPRLARERYQSRVSDIKARGDLLGHQWPVHLVDDYISR